MLGNSSTNFKGNLIYKSLDENSYPITVTIDPALQELLTIASTVTGKLEAYIEQIPDIDDISYMFILKEAILTNKIAGNEASLLDYLKYSTSDEELSPNYKINKIRHCLKASSYGYKLMESMPLSINILKELNKILLVGSRNIDHTTNQILESYNTCQQEQLKQLENLESFMGDDSQIPLIIKAGLILGHYASFDLYSETQGKIDRLFISLYLISNGLISKPILFLSEYFYNHQKEYNDLLASFHEINGKENWLKFFIFGIITSANRSIDILKNILTIQKTDFEKVTTIGRTLDRGITLLKSLYKRPLVRVKDVENITILKNPNALGLISKLINVGILEEITGQKRNRIFGYSKYIKLFE